MASKKNQAKCRVCIRELEEKAICYDMRELPMLAHKFTTCTFLSIDEDERVSSALQPTCTGAIKLAENQNNKVDATQDEHLPEMKINQPKQIPSQQDMLRNVKDDTGKHKTEPETELESEQITESNKEATSYKCEICSMRFLVEHRLIAHKRQHEGLMPYPCMEDGCERAFNRRHCLNEHQKPHLGNSRWFSCEQEGCPKQYRHKPTLIMHQRKSHKLGPELRLHVCEFCGKIFSSTAVLNDHRLTHKEKSELPHACQEADCSRRFTSKEKLKVHMMRHAGIKNFRCPYCGMRKTTRNELKIHMNYHTLERTWPCRFCSKVCNSSGNLQMHVRTVHEGARDYACSFCDRRFAKADTRKYHEMTHTGEKPNKCEECGKRFTQPAALRTHRKIHERQRKEIDFKSTAYTIVITVPVEATNVGVVQGL